jgi:F-type H+-transporting ATPase subunit epsilon
MTLNLEILVPDGVVLSTAVRGVRAADRSGLFGLWPNHEDFATLLVPCVLIYCDEDNREHYAAVDGGVLVLHKGHVSIGTREAVLADLIEEVADAATAMLTARREEEHAARAEFAELQAALLRELPKAERRT